MIDLGPNLSVLLLSLLYGIVCFLVRIAVLIAAIVLWKKIRPSLAVGLLLFGVLLLLRLPSIVASLVYIDPGTLLPDGASQAMQLGAKVGFYFGMVVGLGGALLGVLHGCLQVGMAELAAAPGSAFPVLLRRKGRFKGWHVAAMIGLLSGAVSVGLFALLDVELGDAVRQFQKLMPGLYEQPVWLLYSISLPAALAMAVAEEVLFRGVIQAWIIRLLGGGRWAAIVGIVSASLLWTIGHAANAEPLWIKLTQIFCLGLLFGWLARRWSVEAAIVAHLGLNLVAIGGGAFFFE
jgi:membrane protease YdiL (CAAX protease family)